MAGTHRRFILVSLAVVLLAPLTTAYPWQVCGMTANFTANSTYQANLGVLAAALPKNISSSPDLFATAVVGSAPDQVSALALCRGDANATACSSCLATAFQDVQNMCAYDKDAAIYYDPCALYYSSNVSFLSSVDSVASTTSRVNNQNVTSDHARFNRQVAALVNATADYAAYNSTRRYAAGEADLGAGEFPRVYSWAQCTPDLTPAQCRVASPTSLRNCRGCSLTASEGGRLGSGAATGVGALDGRIDMRADRPGHGRRFLPERRIGLLCAQGDPAGRPVMSSVIMMLGSDTVSLQAPPKPVFYARQNGGRSSGTSFSMSTPSG
ncbi:hypothetical protein ACQ4PT_030746 [Festuca glaucescens]